MANFPDLNDDGKVTRADILKGRGVFKRGGKVKNHVSFKTVARPSLNLNKGKTLGLVTIFAPVR